MRLDFGVIRFLGGAPRKHLEGVRKQESLFTLLSRINEQITTVVKRDQAPVGPVMVQAVLGYYSLALLVLCTGQTLSPIGQRTPSVGEMQRGTGMFWKLLQVTSGEVGGLRVCRQETHMVYCWANGDCI